MSSLNNPFLIKSYSDESGNWYRVYSDGWCEQGGSFGDAYTGYQNKTLNFLIPMKNTEYHVNFINGETSSMYVGGLNSKTTAGCTIIATVNYQGFGTWSACGYVNLSEVI